MKSKMILMMNRFEILDIVIDPSEFLSSFFATKASHIFTKISILDLFIEKIMVPIEYPRQNWVLVEIVISSSAYKVNCHKILKIRDFVVNPFFC